MPYRRSMGARTTNRPTRTPPTPCRGNLRPRNPLYQPGTNPKTGLREVKSCIRGRIWAPWLPSLVLSFCLTAIARAYFDRNRPRVERTVIRIEYPDQPSEEWGVQPPAVWIAYYQACGYAREEAIRKWELHKEVEYEQHT